MKSFGSIRTSLIAASLGVLAFAMPAHAQSGDAKTIAEVTAANKAFAQAKGDARAAMMAPDFVEVHASGWRYERQEDIDFAKNNELYHPKVEIIKATNSTPEVKVYNGDTAVVTGSTETYYAVPNEEDLAITAGTHARDVPAVDKWIRDQQSAQHMSGPGEGSFPNPYRTRYVHVWSKIGGKWMIVFAQATRAGQRGSEVLLGEQQKK